MTNEMIYPTHQEIYEYHGNTAIVITRKQNGKTLWTDEILFDSVEEADEYFNSNCCEGEVGWNN